MPLIQIKLIEGVFSETQKKEMIQKFTNTMMSFEAENLRQATVVIIEEIKSGDWGIGGNAITTADAKVMKENKNGLKKK